jgi:hypothetical protein
MRAADPEARHAEGIVVLVHGIKSRLEALVDAAAACAPRRGDDEGHGSSCGVVEAGGALPQPHTQRLRCKVELRPGTRPASRRRAGRMKRCRASST